MKSCDCEMEQMDIIDVIISKICKNDFLMDNRLHMLLFVISIVVLSLSLFRQFTIDNFTIVDSVSLIFGFWIYIFALILFVIKRSHQERVQ